MYIQNATWQKDVDPNKRILKDLYASKNVKGNSLS